MRTTFQSFPVFKLTAKVGDGQGVCEAPVKLGVKV